MIWNVLFDIPTPIQWRRHAPKADLQAALLRVLAKN